MQAKYKNKSPWALEGIAPFYIFISHMLLLLWIHLTHDIGKKPLIFINTFLSFGISACRCALVTPKVSTLSPSCASNISVHNNTSKYTMGNNTLSPYFRYIFCLLESAQFFPFIFPHLFTFTRFTYSNIFLLSPKDNLYGLIGVTTDSPGMGLLSIWLNYFIINDTDFSPNFSIPALADIWLNMPFADL